MIEQGFGTLFAVPSRNGIYKAKEFHGEGVPIINMGELFAFERIGPQEMKRLRVETKELLNFGVQEGDLLFARRSVVADGVGKCSIIRDLREPTVFESSIIRTRLNTDLALPSFYYYYFQSPEGRGRIKGIATGAAIMGITGTALREVPVPIPPLPTQRKIAAILSAYDDLIENNARRVRVLEEMARALYREWFVEYRFPGHEQAEWVEDEQGRRPAGWKVSTIGESFITILGGTPSRNKPEYWGGEIPWLNSGKANDLRVIEPSEYITSEGYKRSAAKMMPPGATIIAITGATLGQVSRLEIHATGNQSLVGLWGFEDYHNSYIYLATKLEWITQIVSKAGGGAQQHVNKDKINETVIILPSENVLQALDKEVGPIFDLMRSLLFRNANLRRTRDLLLPRLVSGELDVSGLRVLGPGLEGEEQV